MPRETASETTAGAVVDVAPTLENSEASVKVELVPAAELSDQPADLIGGFLSQKGDVIMLGSGFADISPDGEGGYRTEHGGPLVKVKTTGQTHYWADVTQAGAGQASGGTITAQQMVEAVTPPVTIPYPAFMSLWGQWQEDTFIANVILFDVPGD